MPPPSDSAGVRPRLDAWLLVAGLVGAAVLAIELAGGRLLTPLFGQSLALWTVLITVTLCGLAAGYGIGARLARGATPGLLAGLLALAGAAAFGVGLAARGIFGPLSNHPGTIPMAVAAAVAVFPALVALGAAGPVLVECTAPHAGAGFRAGRIFAASTLGSVVGAPVTGLYLLPVLGTRAVFGLTGLALLCAAAVVAIRGGRWRAVAAGGVATLLALGMAGREALPSGAAGAELLGRYRSGYGQALVLEKGGTAEAPARRRILLVDGHVQNAVDPDRGTGPPGGYQDAVRGMLQLQPGRRAAVLGLGAGQLSARWVAGGVRVIAAEPNPAVIEAARAHFGLDTGQVRVVQVDGRLLVRRLEAPVDAIVVDAFTGASVPVHLVTYEALGEAAAALTSGGVWVAWILDTAEDADAHVWPRVARTAYAVFPHVTVWRHPGTGPLAGYLIVGRRSTEHRLRAPPGFEQIPEDMVLWHMRLVPVQTDDRADLDRFSGRLNALAHAEVRRHIAPDIHLLLID